MRLKALVAVRDQGQHFMWTGQRGEYCSSTARSAGFRVSQQDLHFSSFLFFSTVTEQWSIIILLLHGEDERHTIRAGSVTELLRVELKQQLYSYLALFFVPFPAHPHSIVHTVKTGGYCTPRIGRTQLLIGHLQDQDIFLDI